jgi:hypothetical protein
MARLFWSFATAAVMTTLIAVSVLVYIGVMSVAVMMMGEFGHFVALAATVFVVMWVICYFDFP